jgi:hypothetical protein
MEADRITQTAVRVRCPRCAHVFRIAPAPPPPQPAAPPPLDGFEIDTRAPVRARAPQPPPSRAAHEAPARLQRQWTSEPARTLDLGEPAAKGPPPRLETAPFRVGDAPPAMPASPPPAAPTPPPVYAAPPPTPYANPAPRPAPDAGPATTTAVPAAPPAADPRAAHERARRLARVLVSDILVYNRAARDQARVEGSLPATLGPEISKAWELFKSKVGAELASTTPYFKDALNEILAEGETIF